MKHLFLLLLVLCITSLQAQNTQLNLIPQPAEITLKSGFYTLPKTVTVGFNKPESVGVAEKLAQKLRMATGYSIKVVKGNKGQVQLNLNSPPDPKIGNEGYTLVSTSKGVVMAANQPAGLF